MVNSSVCVDANVIVRTLIWGQYSLQATDLLELWQREKTRLIAPAILPYEVASVLRRAVHLKQITSAEGESAFENFWRIPVHLSSRQQIIHLAWKISKKFKRPRVYDTAYLALAQINHCKFWTADERLYNAVSRKLKWVRWIGDYE